MSLERMAKIVLDHLNNKKSKTIFVTVGNGKFDPLVQELDRLKEEGKIKENIIIQLGHGSYRPKYCEWVEFAPSLERYYQQADLIISHGGPGTVFEILRMGRN